MNSPIFGGRLRTAGSSAPEGGRLAYSPRKIRERVAALARAVEGDLPPDGRLLLVGVLKGAAFLLADLARELSRPVRIDFVRLRSYGSATFSSGVPETVVELETDPAGMDVVVVEDVVDTGRSLARLGELLEGRGARSVRYLALVDKTARRERDVRVDYSGFRRRSGFLVGYGMDHAEKYRQLPGIWLLPGGGAEDAAGDGGNG